MKTVNKILLAFGFLILAVISWLVVLNMENLSDKEIQDNLVKQAEEYLNDEIYILALPLLEEAIEINTVQTPVIEERLKGIYLKLIEQDGMRSGYLGLLRNQMSRENAQPAIFMEAAQFQYYYGRYQDALSILREGISRTGSTELIDFYESIRYRFRMAFIAYEDVTAIHGESIGVSKDGLWGIAATDGRLVIPCEYSQISTFSVDRAVVQKEINGRNVIYAVDSKNNRVALLKESVVDFGNLASDRLPVKIGNKWLRTNAQFELGSAEFDWIGTHFNGHAAASLNGKWGVIDTGSTWVIPPEFDRVIMDELDRAFAQNAVFVQKGNSVMLYVNGEQTGEVFEDAKPFGNEGYAAVKRNGEWGFVNTGGEIMIPFRYEDALSFGQHLAAVKIGEFWGFINLRGQTVIEPEYFEAKSFGNGSAPVLTNRGWQFITLTEKIN